MKKEMKILRVFPRRTNMTPTDELVYVGEPDMFVPDVDEIHISCAFTWDLQEAKRLMIVWSDRYPGRVKIGGTAFDDPGNEFEPGRYLRHGVTITSRGCIRNCPWCSVRQREGILRTLAIKT